MSTSSVSPCPPAEAYEQFWAAVDDPRPAAKPAEPAIAMNAYEQFAAAIDA